MDYFLELAIGTVITIITYFLKKTMDKIDKTDYKIQIGRASCRERV